MTQHAQHQRNIAQHLLAATAPAQRKPSATSATHVAKEAGSACSAPSPPCAARPRAPTGATRRLPLTARRTKWRCDHPYPIKAGEASPSRQTMLHLQVSNAFDKVGPGRRAAELALADALASPQLLYGI